VRIIPVGEFREWLAEGGIIQHPRFAVSDRLVCAADEELSRYWLPSFVPSDLPGFAWTALRAASSAGHWYLMRPHGASWYESDVESAPGSNVIIDALMDAAGIPRGATGAIQFEETDWKAISIVVVAHYVYGWSVHEDIHMFGEGRDCAMSISHHGYLRVYFPEMARLEHFRAAMLENGYDLPAQGSDESHKCPEWLKGPVRHGAS